jgi:hypothetical protein
VILIIDIYSCQTDPEARVFQKQWPAERMKVYGKNKKRTKRELREKQIAPTN